MCNYSVILIWIFFFKMTSFVSSFFMQNVIKMFFFSFFQNLYFRCDVIQICNVCRMYIIHKNAMYRAITNSLRHCDNGWTNSCNMIHKKMFYILYISSTVLWYTGFNVLYLSIQRWWCIYLLAFCLCFYQRIKNTTSYYVHGS